MKNKAEAKLVEKLLKAKTYIGLVAETDGKIVGHISFSAVTFEDETTDFVGLAPMSVLPKFQNRGIGSILVKEGLKTIATEGLPPFSSSGIRITIRALVFETAKLKVFRVSILRPMSRSWYLN